MKNEVQIFNFENQNIRTVLVNDEPYFVGKDVAEVLGYTNPSKALSDHVDNEDKLNNELLSSLGQRGGWLINEAGVYSLVFGSKLPSAKKFKKWVTNEVLPSIRKTGSYNLPQSPLEVLELIVNNAKETEKRVEVLEDKISDMPLFNAEMDEISKQVSKKAIACLGGKHSVAYNNRSICKKVYSDIYNYIHRQFDVHSYKAINRKYIDDVKKVISEYELPFLLNKEVETTNGQQQFSL